MSLNYTIWIYVCVFISIQSTDSTVDMEYLCDSIRAEEVKLFHKLLLM